MVLFSAGAPGSATVKGSVFNTAVEANTDIFSSDITATYTPTTFRIYACFSPVLPAVVVGQLIIRRTVGVNTLSEQLNGGGALAVNAAYTFDIVVEIGDSINIWHSIAAHCNSLKVVEVPGAVS